MPDTTRVDRVRGSLLGLAVGDALGAPLEGLNAQQIRHHYGIVTDYVDGVKAWKKKPNRWRLPGLYTDDTQQALALIDVLLACRASTSTGSRRSTSSCATPEGGYAGRTAAWAGASARCSTSCRRAPTRGRPARAPPASAPRCGSRRWLSTSPTIPRPCSTPSWPPA